jgi:hypothetical protein
MGKSQQRKRTFFEYVKESEEKEKKTEPRFVLRGVLCDRSLLPKGQKKTRGNHALTV